MKIIFPDLNRAFVNRFTLEDACNAYIEILDKEYSLYNSQYSNRLSRFLDIENHIEYLELDYYALKKFLRKWSKEHKTNVIIKMRRKSFIGYNEKIRLYLSNERDLSLIRDLIGFRLVLCTGRQDNLETHQLCYTLMNDVLTFFQERKCLLLVADNKPASPYTIPENLASKIFTEDLVLSEYKGYVENYVLNPKKDGYQGLHACLESKMPFEIQVKTFAMDWFADTIHCQYKAERYESSKIFLDLDKIQIEGVAFDNDGKIISDYSGLFKGLDLLNRL